ncbi:MAG: hypothetical protein KKF44_01745 [Nanoarchaeota archaeon]|nr:hypothetical protein [Nanoarchaeota archaeon]
MQNKRGRPPNSRIRDNIIEILHFIKKGYGYDIFKIYRQVFPKVTLRSIYYHLNKGVELGLFVFEKVKNEKGDYSWGETAEKIYYSLGHNAKPIGIKKIKEYLDSQNGK